MTATTVVAVVVALAVLLAAVVGSAETVLLRLNVVRALRLEEEGHERAPALVWFLEHRSSSLAVVLLVTLTLRIAAAGGVAWLVLVEARAGMLALAGALLALAVLNYVLAEVAPRTLALRHLEQTGLRVAPAFTALVKALDPIARGLGAVGRSIVRTREDITGPYASDDELQQLASEDEDDEIEPEERAMIASIFELGETVVREIMVPRPDMVLVDDTTDLRTVLDTFIEHGYSRLPVQHESQDDIVGIIYAKDVLESLATRPNRTEWMQLIRDATFVPENKRVDDLLRELQSQAVHLAVVVDEYGAIAGLVTIEDVLEEIVGEIVDEHDHEEPLVESLDDDAFRIDARLPVDDLNDLLSTELPDDPWDSVGGLLFGTLGRVPRPGEQVQIDGLTLVAERVQGRRISKVLVRRTNDEQPEGQA